MNEAEDPSPPPKIDYAGAKLDGDALRLTLVCGPDFHTFTIPRHVAAALAGKIAEALV